MGELIRRWEVNLFEAELIWRWAYVKVSLFEIEKGELIWGWPHEIEKGELIWGSPHEIEKGEIIWGWPHEIEKDELIWGWPPDSVIFVSREAKWFGLKALQDEFIL